MVAKVRAGESRVLVIHGEAGIGKTALLDYLSVQAAGCLVIHTNGVQSEMELAFAGLQQLCAPVLERLGHIPSPQRDALRTVFGLSAGPPPDQLLVGLAVLSLLSDAAEQQPLLCLVDDQQWLDRASARVLQFVARRLAADSVGLVFATRTVSTDLATMPQLLVTGIREADARRLLASVLNGPIDLRVRDQLVAESDGNPLALLELPQGLAMSQLAGGFGLPEALPHTGRFEQSFVLRIESLPASTRALLLLAAADPSGDTALVWRAAERLGLGTDSSTPAAEAGLAEFGARVRFRHPLVRSAAYRSRSLEERRRAHRVLAEARIRGSTRTGVRGIGRTPLRGPTRMWPRNSSTPPAAPRHVVAWRRQRHSSGVRPR